MTHTSGRLLARNTLWNLLGQAAPMVAAVASIPVLIHSIGTERFAILSLAWIVIGYFSLFDLGLSRALTQVVADRLGASDGRDLPEVVWTALALMSALGVLGALILAALTPWVVGGGINVPPALRTETVYTMLLLAVGLPFVISAGGLRGVLEAYQRFDVVNAIRIPTGIFSYLGPLVVLPFTRSLAAVVAVLVVGRVAGWLAHLYFCVRLVPELGRRVSLRPRLVAPLLRFGGWITVSNVISPLMTYVDRFVIGALLPVAAVAYYVTPYEVVTRLWVIPGAVSGAVFPALAGSYAANRVRARDLFFAGVRATTVAVFPVVLILSTLAPEGLHLWLGGEFARESTPVLRWLAAGILVNSVGQIAAAAVQGAARPDLSAKLHALEFPFYMVSLWVLVRAYGVTGAAIAWTLRVSVDTLVLLFMSDRLLAPGAPVSRWALGALALAGAALALGTLPQGAGAKALFLAAVCLAFAALAWFGVVQPHERARLLARLGSHRDTEAQR
ncbi:MAG TPA: flippase [Longimicrobium sp.]|jgi:O-antigen/teichoic acid export membrane protein